MKFSIVVAAIAVFTGITHGFTTAAARDDECTHCNEQFDKCMNSGWCWIPGTNCRVSCNTDTCMLPECHKRCGYDNCN